MQMFVNREDIDHRVDMFLPHPSIVMGNQQIGRITRQIKNRKNDRTNLSRLYDCMFQSLS